MSRAIVYCDRCGRIILQGDISRGRAIVGEKGGVCAECAEKLAPDEREAVGRALSGEAAGPASALKRPGEPRPSARKVSSPTGAARGTQSARAKAARPQSTRTSRRVAPEGGPPQAARSYTGLAVAGIGAGALVGIAVAVLMAGRSNEEARPDTGAPAAGPTATIPEAGGAPPPPEKPLAPPQAPGSLSAERFAEVKRTFDASFTNYTEGRKVLREFLKEFPEAPEAEEAKALLAAMGGDETKLAKEAVAKALERAKALGKLAEAKKVFGSVRERFGENEWFKADGEKRMAEALAEIERGRVAAARAAVARAREAFDSKRFDEARAALGAREGWPEEVRREAESFLKEIAPAAAAFEKERERREAWRRFLIELQAAGRKSVEEAAGVAARRQEALREAGLGKRAARLKDLVREARLVDELAAMALAGSKRVVRLRVRGRRVGGKVLGVEGGVLRLQPSHGAPVGVPLVDVDPEDIVAASGLARAEGGDPLRAAAYLTVRGELDGARSLIAGLVSDKAFALGDDIDEISKMVPPPKPLEPGAPEETAPADPLMRGLVGHWKLDDPFGKRVTDSSGGGRHGTVYGARRTTGKLGRALGFSGAGAHVKIPSGFADFTGGITIALWARPEAVRKWARFVELSNGRERDNVIFARSDKSNDLSFDIYDGKQGGRGVRAGNVIELDKWQHLAATCDGSGNVVLYKNGRRVGSGRTRVPRKLERTFNRLGQSSWAQDQDYKGRMDDVRIYDRALSAAEIAKVFGGRIDSAPARLSAAAGSLTKGLAGHWKLDEKTGTRAADSSGKGRHGTLKGGAKWVAGKIGGAITFDGKDDYVSAPDAADLRVAGDITVALWMYQRAAAKDYVRVVGKGDRKYRNYGLWLPRGGGGPMLFQQYGGSGRSVLEINSKTAIETSQWYHIAGVVSGSRAHIYVNGRLDASGSRSGRAGTSSAPLTMGCAGYHGYFPGLLDDVRVYSRALSGEEIKALFEGRTSSARPGGRGHIGHWKLDEKTGTRAADTSGKGRHGTVKGGAKWTAGKLGGALAFDGKDDCVELGGADVAPPWTAAMWVRKSDTTAASALLDSAEYSLRLEQSNDNVGFTHYTVRDHDFGYRAPVGVWTHLVFVGTASGTTLYVNGERRARRAAVIRMPMARIGGRGHGRKDWLKGAVDDVRVFNRALSGEEVKALFEGRTSSVRPGARGPTRGLVAHWELDEKTGTRATDSSGKGRHGTLKGGAKWTKGKMGGGVAFDGKNGHVEVSHHSSINPTGAITVAAWARSNTSNWNDSGFLVSKRNAYILHPEKGSKKVLFYVHADGWRSATFMPAIDIKGWHHYAGTYDGSTVRLYIDGRPVASTPYKGSIDADTGRLCIGWDEGQRGRHFNGSIDDARIYTRALSHSEIGELAGVPN